MCYKTGQFYLLLTQIVMPLNIYVFSLLSLCVLTAMLRTRCLSQMNTN